jgi:pantothenate kinase
MPEAISVSEVRRLAELLRARPQSLRALVAIAGPPGSGKSTLADALAAELNRVKPGTAAVLPMDGYHYDDIVLSERHLLTRKGSPETFDVGGLRHMLTRLRANDEAEVAVPVFDRALEIARAGARVMPQSVRTVIVEGNYLLLNRPPWAALNGLFTATVMLKVPENELRRRLMGRWRSHGLDEAASVAKVENNDLPNGRIVVAESRHPDFIFDGNTRP